MNGEPRYVHNIPAARRLRKVMTEAETMLWQHLRARRFNGLKFRRQHAINQYVVDFYCEELQLVVELDGPVHIRPDVRINDLERQTQLEFLGYRVVRITNERILADVTSALNDINDAITRLCPTAAEESGE